MDGTVIATCLHNTMSITKRRGRNPLIVALKNPVSPAPDTFYLISDHRIDKNESSPVWAVAYPATINHAGVLP